MNDQLLQFALLSLFVAVFVGAELFYLWWWGRMSPAARRLARRMESISGGASRVDPAVVALRHRLQSNEPGLKRLRAILPRVKQLDSLIEQSGSTRRLGAVLRLCVIAAASLSGVMAVLQQGVAMVLAAGAVGLWAPIGWLLFARARRVAAFNAQLPDALDLIGRALRAGHALTAALQMAGEELSAPAGQEFARTCDEIRFGMPMHEALQKLALRVPSTDLGFFVIAVLIQRETGGNLAEVLSNISQLIRDRIKLSARVDALSAEGRFSGVVLGVLPFVTGAALYAVDSEFMSLLWVEKQGVVMLKVAGVLLCVGAVWMRHVVRIRV